MPILQGRPGSPSHGGRCAGGCPTGLWTGLLCMLVSLGACGVHSLGNLIPLCFFWLASRIVCDSIIDASMFFRFGANSRGELSKPDRFESAHASIIFMACNLKFQQDLIRKRSY